MALSREEIENIADEVASSVVAALQNPEPASSKGFWENILEKNTIDSATWPEDKPIWGAAIPRKGCLSGWHVTDDPGRIVQTLQKGEDIAKQGSGEYEDLRTNGIYFSAAPQLWTGRAPAKYRFLRQLTPDQRRILGEAILKESRARGPGYLAPHEIENLEKDVSYFIIKGEPAFIISAADQPYNIRFWKQEFLAPLGITNPAQPQAVPITACGKFVNLTNIPSRQWVGVITLAKQKDYAGALQETSLVAVPQAVVWKSEAVAEFDDYHKKEG